MLSHLGTTREQFKTIAVQIFTILSPEPTNNTYVVLADLKLFSCVH